MKIGFISENYNEKLQLGVMIRNRMDKIFFDLRSVIDYVRKGDEIYVTSFIFLPEYDDEDESKSKSPTLSALNFVSKIKEIGAVIKSINEPDLGELGTAVDKLALNIFLGMGTFIKSISAYHIKTEQMLENDKLKEHIATLENEIKTLKLKASKRVPRREAV
jgi:hypothetical protein